MTEITVKNSFIKWLPEGRRPEKLIDPVAFTAAFVLAPIAFAAGFFWIFLIPVVGIFLGAPAYILVGLPVLWVALRRGPITSAQAMGLGVIAFLIFIILASAAWLLFTDLGPDRLGETAVWYVPLGLLHAPIWCAIFAGLYARWEREFYNQYV